MKIKVDYGVKEYMMKHKHEVMTVELKISDCCTGNVNSMHPEIVYHAPKNLDDYFLFEEENFKFYVNKRIKLNGDTLEIIYDKLLFRSAPNLKNINLDYVKSM
jgi:hypothetical protein